MKFDIRYEYSRARDRACLWIAHRLPARLRMWTVIDACAKATTGKFSNRAPGEVSCFDIIDVVKV